MNQTLLFADVCNSTQLYEQLGDLDAKERISARLDEIIEIAETHQGTIVKTIGDEVMLRFDTPSHAVLAAQDMQKPHVPDQLEIKVALHHGPTILEDDDVFGDAVNIASRLVSLSKPGQILTSGVTVEALDSALIESCRLIDRTEVKGKTDVIDIYEVISLEDDITQMNVDLTTKPTLVLLMRYDQKELRFGGKDGTFTIGRHKHCDLVINEELASRQHVTLESKRGKFYLVDRSTNGTWLRNETGRVMFLRREEILLPPTGDISFGKHIDDEPDMVLRFRIARG